MGPKPINALLKPHFDKIVAAAQVDAAAQIAQFKISLQCKDHFTQAKLTLEEFSRVESAIEENDHPYYVNNSDSWLLTQFANRCLLLNVDESEALRQAVYLGCYRSHLWNLKKELKSNVPSYTYKDFLSGNYNAHFFQLQHFYNVTEEDYYKIKDWQAATLLEIVQHDYMLLVSRLQKHCQTLLNPIEFIEAENKRINEQIVNFRGDAGQLLVHLDSLFLFSGTDLTNLDPKLLEKSHRHLISGITQLDLSDVHPRSFSPSQEEIRAMPECLTLNEVALFHVVNKVQDWIKRILNGQAIDQPEPVPDWDQVLQEINIAASAAIEKEEMEIDEQLATLEGDAENIKKYLFERFEYYRAKFNKFENKYLFHLFDDERKHLVRRTFITNAFFSSDLPAMSKALQEGLTIQGCLWSVVSIYGSEFDTHKMDLPSGPAGSHIEILSLLNQMVHDKASYAIVEQSMINFGTQFEQYFLPFEVHLQNQNDVWCRQFFAGIDRLQEILDHADPSKKIHYLQTRIKDLRHRELELNAYYALSGEKEESPYLGLFKEFLSIEADYVRETLDLPISLSMLLSLDRPQTNHPPQSLDDLVDVHKKEFIFQLLEDLRLTKEGISIVGERKKGALRGVVEALRDRNILPSISLDLLCKLIAAEIKLELKSKLDYSAVMKEFKKKADSYITSQYTA